MEKKPQEIQQHLHPKPQTILVVGDNVSKYNTVTLSNNDKNNANNNDNKGKEYLMEDDLSLSPEQRLYAKKCRILKGKYQEILISSYRLRNRLYKVRKQIIYLGKLKRVLFQTLHSQKDNFMETCLEIPDDDNYNEEVDEIIGNVLNSTVIKPPPVVGGKKRKIDNSRRKVVADIKIEMLPDKKDS
uniref:INO80 complex subunit E n=1 Tax=Strongyloides venezuelensis TaxID=75913 RepID=A0A0K0EWH1_STRVS